MKQGAARGQCSTGDGACASGHVERKRRLGMRWFCRSGLTLVVVLVGCAGGFAGAAAAATDLLPSLVADPPDGAVLQGDTGQLLLRFNGYVHNSGQGPLDIRASRATTSHEMTVDQRIYSTDGTSHDVPLPKAHMIYVTADGHNHWHLQKVAAYSLWNQAKSKEIAPSVKVGFCLEDSQHVDSGGPSTGVYTDENGRAFCQANNPAALSVFEGISSGWRDLYEAHLTFQWVVVSNVRPGVYWLREDVDPTGMLIETPSSRPFAYATTSTTIPGYNAKPLTVGSSGSKTAIRLQAARFAPKGPARYRIVKPPAHGTLSVPKGQWFDPGNVTYHADAGYHGPDSFTYVAGDSLSLYPLHPADATVSINTPPRVSRASESAKRWRESDALAQITATPVGTTFSFSLNEPARATLLFTQSANGGKRSITVGKLTFAGHDGLNEVRFAGHVSARNKLKLGRYTLQITARNAQGIRSAPRSVTFTIVK